jgi:long-chain acyl-CoA synthetase
MAAADISPPGDSAPALLFARAARDGAATALRYKHLGLWRDVSFAEYSEAVRTAGLGLMALGVAPGDCVAVIGENRREWLYADLAAQSVGAITVGIYTTNAAPECAYILGHSESVVFIVENEEQLDKALEVRGDLPRLKWIVVMDMDGLREFADPMVISWDELMDRGRAQAATAAGEFDARLAAIDADATAILIYTSGTTGPPKGAMLSHRNITWTGRCLVDVFGVGPEEDVVSFLPLSHIAERLLSTYLALAAGYRVHFIENVDAVTQNIIEVSPTLMFSVPRIWEKYQSLILIRMKDAQWFKRLAFGAAFAVGRAHAHARLDDGRVPMWLALAFRLAELAVMAKLRERLGFDRLQVAVSGAAAISPDVLRFFHALGVPLRQIYGQTEGSGPTSCHRGDIIDPANAGPAIPGVELAIAADGEILMRGPNVFLGYFRNPQATAETLEGGWLHTGDVGEIDARGFLSITDRKKDLLITSGGKNIAPQPIENQLKTSPYITDAILIGDGRNFITALVVIDEENVVKYAQDHKVQYTTYASLTETRAISELIHAEVRKVNQALARVEQIKRFCILPKKLLEEDGEVTPTMKVKRRSINHQFADLIEGMYHGKAGISV